MVEYPNVLDLIFDNLKKFFYPQEWISLDLEFSKSELFAMLLVDKQGEMMMSEIADNIGISMSTASGIIERLVKNGYVNRDRSETDRRIVVVRLTEQGKRLIAQLKCTVFEYIRSIDESLEDEERQLLLKIFTKILDVLDKKRPRPPEADSASQLKRIEIE